MTQTTGLEAFTEFNRLALIAVATPVMILAGIATYMNSRASVARQSPEAAANPQTALMNKLALYVFPLGVVVGGPFLPLAIILYWFANNIWTFGQQHYVFGKIEKEEEAKKQEALERRAASAPPPGAKPVRPRKSTTPSPNGSAGGDTSGDRPDSAGAEPKAKDTGTGSTPRPRVAGAPGHTPRPGARPKKRKR
jgi:YidC/Oxa1 family membrane protein insertase